MKEQLIKYIKEVLGFEMLIHQLNAAIKGKLPLYLRDEYQWYEVVLENRQYLFAVTNQEDHAGISQLEKQFQKVTEITEMPVVAIFDYLEAIIENALLKRR